ncbi:hypothetical protein Tco_0223100, partial [Tanacetum coccineum]
IYDGGGGLAAGFDDRNDGEDEESRFLGESRVKDTFNGEYGSLKVGEHVETKETREEFNEKQKEKDKMDDFNVEGDNKVAHNNEVGDNKKEQDSYKNIRESRTNNGNTRGDIGNKCINNGSGHALDAN